MTIEDQAGFDPRLAWASEGGTLLAPVCPVLVVVDILRFTTAVEVATTNGAQVIPRRWPAREGPDGAGPPLDPLSPVSLLEVPAGTRMELARCLRNASAVAAAARDLGRPVGVVPAGERRPDGSLRPAVEDLIGAGAILHALGGRPSPEARAAVAAFLDAAPTCRPPSPPASPAASWPPATSPPTSAWRQRTTSARRSPASPASSLS